MRPRSWDGCSLRFSGRRMRTRAGSSRLMTVVHRPKKAGPIWNRTCRERNPGRHWRAAPGVPATRPRRKRIGRTGRAVRHHATSPCRPARGRWTGGRGRYRAKKATPCRPKRTGLGPQRVVRQMEGLEEALRRVTGGQETEYRAAEVPDPVRRGCGLGSRRERGAYPEEICDERATKSRARRCKQWVWNFCGAVLSP